MPDAVADPLHRFPVFRTSNPEHLRHFASDLFGASRIELKNIEKFEARVNLIELQDTGLAFGATSCELAIDRFATDFIRLQMAVRGRARTFAGGTTAEIDQGHFAVTPSGVASRTICEAEHQRLILRLNREPLVQKLAALLGARPKGELEFDPAIKARDARAQGLSRLVGFLSQQLDSPPAALPKAVSRELEQAVQVAFLFASRHSFSHLLERQEALPAPGIVCRLEEFIEAHWREAITIERLAAEAGVSVRAVFRAFERSRGYSPMAFAKGVRLKHAREILMSGDPAVSVTATAFKTNFANPSRFAKDYREAFGELPSQTVSRTRR